MNMEHHREQRKPIRESGVILGNFGGIRKEKSQNKMYTGCGCYCNCPDTQTFNSAAGTSTALGKCPFPFPLIWM